MNVIYEIFKLEVVLLCFSGGLVFTFIYNIDFNHISIIAIKIKFYCSFC